jgi:hypothetical protein
MSLDTLLIIIFLVVLPLIEMLRAAAQKRKEQAAPPEPPRKRLPPQRQPPEPARVSQAPEPAVRLDAPVVDVPVAAASVPARETMSDKIAARRRATRPQTAAESLRIATERSDARMIPGVVRGLRSRGGVHRAIVAMTILGPCRAVEPHAWNQRDRLY